MQDIDKLTRDELPEKERAVSDVLDEWNVRLHGILSGHHGTGLFLELLAKEGYEVTRIVE